MNIHEKYMRRCLEIAANGLGNTAPNPMVGCVIVHKEKIIGEGYHQLYGEAHAEVNAIRSAMEEQFRGHAPMLAESTLYVNLEPCAHYGKTPPCTDLILKHNIPEVVIGCMDSHEKVAGKGIEKLKENGRKVVTGILEDECRKLNRRFFTFHEKKRPYIILKWAQTINGFIAEKGKKNQISNLNSQILTHKWRSEEQAIMVGTNTALTDDPQLNVRLWNGKNPVRAVLDKNLRLPHHLRLFDTSQPTLVFTSLKKDSISNLHFETIDFTKDIIHEILTRLFERNIQSLIIEGGALLLNSFLETGMWDEARVFISDKTLQDGVKAPHLPYPVVSKEKIGNNELIICFNHP